MYKITWKINMYDEYIVWPVTNYSKMSRETHLPIILPTTIEHAVNKPILFFKFTDSAISIIILNKVSPIKSA